MKVKTKVYDVLDKLITFDLPKARHKVRIGRGKSAYTLLELYSGFDIETTNVRQIDGWAAYAYHMQLSLYSDKEHYVYLFRRWEVVEWFFDLIANVYDLGVDNHIIMWVANLSFEFQFMRKRFQWDDGEYDFFAKEERQPLKATYRGIELREALAISGGNLAQLAEDYCTTKKLITYDKHGAKISDLDYRKERTSKTKLTDQERAYCINDVVILAEFSEYIFRSYIRDKRKVPMTKTSMLIEEYRDDFKAMCKAIDKCYHRTESYTEQAWREFLLRCYPDLDTYREWFKYLFRGGYVHANALYVGADGYECRMKDITSSYPGRMNLAYYPRTPFKKVKYDPSYLKSKCCILRAEFDFIRIKTPHTIESRNKIITCINGKFDNGRLVSADHIEVLLTELDFEIYNLFYVSQCTTITECYISERGKLPPYLIDVLNKSYREKQHLKATGQKDTQKYAITKAKVNTNFGATVKRIRLDKITIDDTGEWCREQVEDQFEQERNKSLLLPQWGIWVTSAARYELLKMLHKLTAAGVEVVYMDTDSIKYIPSHKAEQIFKHYNNQIRRRLHNRKLRSLYFSDLSMFDNEIKNNQAVRFKTLGAKRYIYQEGEVIHATVSGMPKSSIYNLGDGRIETIFDTFDLVGYNLPPGDSGKLTTKYRDEPHEGVIGSGKDREKMKELTSVALYEIPFSLTLKGEFITYVDDIQKEKRAYL